MPAMPSIRGWLNLYGAADQNRFRDEVESSPDSLSFERDRLVDERAGCHGPRLLGAPCRSTVRFSDSVREA